MFFLISTTRSPLTLWRVSDSWFGKCWERCKECTQQGEGLAHEQKPQALKRRNCGCSWGLTQLLGALGWQSSEREYLWEVWEKSTQTFPSCGAWVRGNYAEFLKPQGGSDPAGPWEKTRLVTFTQLCVLVSLSQPTSTAGRVAESHCEARASAWGNFSSINFL